MQMLRVLVFLWVGEVHKIKVGDMGWRVGSGSYTSIQEMADL